MGINKWVQERCYTVLSRRWGMGACVAVAVAALNLALLALSLPFLLSHRGGKVDSFYPAFPCGAPVDIVYTWVNGSDPLHIQLLQEYKQRAIIAKSNLSAINASQGLPSDVAGQSRFVDNEELRYSLRSVEKFAPWVNHIYLVTNGQIPYWLDLNNPKLSLVTHEEIFLNQSHLPTFSSPAIEAHLHRIPHLAPDFIYLNDDVMFGAPIWPSTFTSEADGQRVFLAWPVPPCAEGCSATWLGDGYCDRSCNVSACEYDGGDCLNTTQTVPSWWATNTKTDDRYSKYCTRSCPDSWVGDTFCDKMCNVADCGFDGGDCGVDSIFSTMMGWSARNSQTYIVPDETLAVYFNLSTPSGSVNFSVTEGNHNNPVLVRTAVITKKYGVMVVLFNKNQTRDNVTFSIITTADTLGFIISAATLSSNRTMKNPTQTSNNSESSIKLTEQSEASPRAYSSRHLLDAFGDSLIYVNSLYNKEFGYSARKVPAHMPHMMNADVITEMQARWPEQWDLTSSHRFRDSRDMQFAFSYYYFLMSEVSEFNLTRLWETLDLDRDGVLGKGEFRNMAVNLLSPPLLKNGADILYHKIANCTYDINITEVPVFQNITLETLQTCNRTIDMLEDAYWGLKYKFRLSNLDDVAFIMVNTNDTSLQKRLDSIREKSNKFICLNDNMNHSHPAAQHTIQVLQNFYQSLFPLPSQYELPPGRRNRFLHMDELRRAQKIVAAKNLYIIVASGIFIFVMLSVACCCVCSSTTSPSKRKMAKRMKNLLEP